MAIQDFQAGYAIGNDLGSAVGRGIAEWKKIQKEKQQKREFEGRIGVYNQRIMSIEQAMMATDDDKILSEYKARQQRYPDAEIEMVPTGGVNKETNAAETEPMIRTPEGDIPVNQVTQIRNRQAQNNVEKIKAQMSALMELQASLPDNPYARQFVAATGANLMTQFNIEVKQQEAELRAQESYRAQRQLELDERKYREEPERETQKKATETAFDMQRDAARIEAERRAQISVAEAKGPEGPKQTDIAGMRKEFEGKSDNFSTIRSNKAKIDALAQQPSNSANDLAILYSYIKLLDPGSVVREGEVQLTREGSVPDQIVSEYKRLFTTAGSRLGPEVRQQIVQNSATVYESGVQTQRALQERYSGLAQRAGFDPQDVVQDYTTQQQQAAPAAGGRPPEVQSVLDKYK